MENFTEFYNRIYWENKQDSLKTPLGKTNLNKMDSAIKLLDTRTVALYAETVRLDTVKADKVELNGMITNWEFDETTGIVTLTRYDKSTVKINTLLHKLAINFKYDAVNEKLIITQSDGTEVEVDMSALITQYEFLDTDTIVFSVNTDGKVSAIVKEGSIGEEHLNPDYLADIKIEVAKAKGYAKDAQDSATAAAYDAKLSQSYSVGGSGVREGEDKDNSKYYYEQTKDIAQNAKTIKTYKTDYAVSDSGTEVPENEIVETEILDVELTDYAPDGDTFGVDIPILDKYNVGAFAFFGSGNDRFLTTERMGLGSEIYPETLFYFGEQDYNIEWHGYYKAIAPISYQEILNEYNVSNFLDEYEYLQALAHLVTDRNNYTTPIQGKFEYIGTTSIGMETSTTKETWSENIPEVPQGKYLWTRVTIKFSDNTSTTYYSVAYNGKDGKAAEATSGIKSLVSEYAVGDDYLTPPPKYTKEVVRIIPEEIMHIEYEYNGEYIQGIDYDNSDISNREMANSCDFIGACVLVSGGDGFKFIRGTVTDTIINDAPTDVYSIPKDGIFYVNNPVDWQEYSGYYQICNGMSVDDVYSFRDILYGYDSDKEFNNKTEYVLYWLSMMTADELTYRGEIPAPVSGYIKYLGPTSKGLTIYDEMLPIPSWKPEPFIIPENKYLWTRTTMTLSDDSKKVFYSVMSNGGGGSSDVSKALYDYTDPLVNGANHRESLWIDFSDPQFNNKIVFTNTDTSYTGKPDELVEEGEETYIKTDLGPVMFLSHDNITSGGSNPDGKSHYGVQFGFGMNDGGMKYRISNGVGEFSPWVVFARTMGQSHSYWSTKLRNAWGVNNSPNGADCSFTRESLNEDALFVQNFQGLAGLPVGGQSVINVGWTNNGVHDWGVQLALAYDDNNTKCSIFTRIKKNAEGWQQWLQYLNTWNYSNLITGFNNHLAIRSGSWVGEYVGTASHGANEYVAFAMITVKNAYANRPLVFLVSGRGWEAPTILSVQFNNMNDTNPVSPTFYFMGQKFGEYYLSQADTSKWYLWAMKNELYGSIEILSMHYNPVYFEVNTGNLATIQTPDSSWIKANITGYTYASHLIVDSAYSRGINVRYMADIGIDNFDYLVNWQNSQQLGAIHKSMFMGCNGPADDGYYRLYPLIGGDRNWVCAPSDNGGFLPAGKGTTGKSSIGHSAWWFRDSYIVDMYTNYIISKESYSTGYPIRPCIELNPNGGSPFIKFRAAKSTGGSYGYSCGIEWNRAAIGNSSSYFYFIPYANGIGSIGNSSYKWGQFYATNSSISTSDRNQKKEISYIGEESEYNETRMSKELFLKFFKMLKSVIFKRDPNESERPHHGIIAQDFEEVLKELGIDHAAFIKSPKIEIVEYEEEEEVEKEELDPDSPNGRKTIKVKEIVKKTREEVIPDEYVYGMRYEELISDTICALQYAWDEIDKQQEIIQQQQEKIDNMEMRLAALESVVKDLNLSNASFITSDSF